MPNTFSTNPFSTNPPITHPLSAARVKNLTPINRRHLLYIVVSGLVTLAGRISLLNAGGMRDAFSPPLVTDHTEPASTINTPNNVLLVACNNTKDKSAFTFPNEAYPNDAVIATKHIRGRAGVTAAVGGVRALAGITTISTTPVTGLVEFDSSATVVFQTRFMVELLKVASSQAQFVQVLKDVMFGDTKQPDLRPLNLEQSLKRNNVHDMNPEIIYLFNTCLANSYPIENMWAHKELNPFIDSFENTVFKSKEAFKTVKALAEKDRIATILVDLNDQDGTNDLYDKLKQFGHNQAPALLDISNAHWRHFTGASFALCNLIKAMAKDDKASTVLFTDQEDNWTFYKDKIFNSNTVEKRLWTYYAFQSTFIVEKDALFPTCSSRHKPRAI